MFFELLLQLESLERLGESQITSDNIQADAKSLLLQVDDFRTFVNEKVAMRDQVEALQPRRDASRWL